MPVDLVQLRTFVAVAEEQHVTRAAERLHLSPSAASGHVRAIEESLDTILFVRTKRNIELTEDGRLLLVRAKKLLHEEALFSSFAREIKGSAKGHVVIASNSDPEASRIGDIVSRIRQWEPLVTVDLRTRTSTATRQGLKTGELDVGIFYGKATDPDLTHVQLDIEAFVVVGPSAWRGRIAEAGWAELAAMPWAVPSEEGMAYKIMLDEIFGNRGLQLHAVARYDSEAASRSMVACGVGLALHREEQAIRAVESGMAVVAPLVRIACPLNLASLSRRKNDPLIKTVVAGAVAAFSESRATSMETSSLAHEKDHA
jgi:DNA-binding transcriptional LysR family regulator